MSVHCSRLNRRLFVKLGVATAALTGSSPLAFSDDEPVKMAVAGAMTGPLAPMGEQMRQGATLAVENINAEGGVLGHRIVLETADDEGDPEQAEAVARRLAKKGVKFVIGHYNSGPSMYASEVYAKAGVLMISPSSTNPSFTERDPRFVKAPFLAKNLWNTFRTSGRDDTQGTILGQYIVKNFPDMNVAILHDGTGYGVGLAEKAKKALDDAGVTKIYTDRTRPRQSNFSKLLSAMKRREIQVVFYGGLGEDLGRLIRRSHDNGFMPQFLGGDGILTRDFPELGGEAVEGTLMAFSKEDRENPAAAGGVSAFRRAGFEPEAYTLKTYAAVQVIAKGIELSGDVQPRAVADAIRSGVGIGTVIGQLTFDSLGDRREPDVDLFVWRKDASGRIMAMPLKQ